jgi:ketosteroid isomerase-like protein
MARSDRFFDLWNEQRVRAAVAETTDDYWYQDAVLGGPHDRAAHVDIMERVIARYPDRRITISRTWTEGDVDIVEYRWRGTSVDGEVLEADWIAIVEFDGNRMKSQRHYRGV